ncbi:hypothetical protein IAR55_006078 [Kwoniella newhampshirensis]|uniref:Xylose isomerase-like TIM barrel domain-containing protein n=1 Tax=Kwoniella newhampshirensis TaxID=1651941 RepID=A0AAW0YUP8_9TREE
MLEDSDMPLRGSDDGSTSGEGELGLDWISLWEDIIRHQYHDSVSTPSTPFRSNVSLMELDNDKSLATSSSSSIDEFGPSSPISCDTCYTYRYPDSPPPLDFAASQLSQDSFHLKTPPYSGVHHGLFPDELAHGSYARTATSSPRKRKWRMKEESDLHDDMSTAGVQLNDRDQRVESPFSRLSICTPKRRLATPTPTSSRASASNRVAACPTIELTKPDTLALDPRHECDTPTPIRHRRPLFLDIPRQPIFLPDTMHALSNDDSPSNAKSEPDAPTSLDVSTHSCYPSNPFPPYRNQDTDTCTSLINENGDASRYVKINWITHLSTDGGLIRSLHRLTSILKLNEELGGVSMFINHPKRMVKRKDRPEDVVWQSRLVFRDLGEAFQQRSMAHAVHTTNLLSPDPEMRRKSKESIIAEMQWARDLGIPTLVIHSGTGEHGDDVRDRNRAMGRLILDLKEITDAVPQVTLGLENTVHPSPYSLTKLSSLATLLHHFPSPQLKICLDLCHLHVSEFDLNTSSGRRNLSDLLGKIGRDRLVGIHVSDSSIEHGGRGDRHVNIGYGHIDLNSFRQVLRHPVLQSVPTLLETPRYFKHLRFTGSPHSVQLAYLESDRSALERSFLQNLVNLSDKEWEDRRRTAEMRGIYKRQKKRVERKIYKVVLKRGGATWTRFQKGRKQDQGCCRVVHGARERTRRREIKEEQDARSNLECHPEVKLACK